MTNTNNPQLSRKEKKIVDKWYKECNKKDEQGWQTAINRRDIDRLLKLLKENK